jgi:hypothetical protein
MFKDSVSTSQKTHNIVVLKTNLLTLFSGTGCTRANNAHVGRAKSLINKNYNILNLMNIVGQFLWEINERTNVTCK